MTGADLKCPECGAGAADVAPDYDLDGWTLVPAPWGVEWTCIRGHKWITGTRLVGDEGEVEFVSMPVRREDVQ